MSCPDCFSGYQHDGKPVGKMIKLHGLETYAVEPPGGREAKGIIIIIPDAFGIDFINNKLLADTYACKGDYRVYLPDFMLGHSCPSWLLDSMKAIVSPGSYLFKPYHVFWGAYAFLPWLYYCRPARSFPTIKTFFDAFRKDEGAGLPVGVAGFCWGGKHTISLTHAENYLENDGSFQPMLDAAFVGHPSFLDLPGDVNKINIATFFAVPEKDHHVKVPKDTDMIRKIIKEKPDAQRGEVKVYEGCAHGFCVRADPLSGDVTKQAVEAEDQAIAWFNNKLAIKAST